MGYGTNDPVTNMLGANTHAERSALVLKSPKWLKIAS
jgi:hypothetical protein